MKTKRVYCIEIIHFDGHTEDVLSTGIVAVCRTMEGARFIMNDAANFWSQAGYEIVYEYDYSLRLRAVDAVNNNDMGYHIIDNVVYFDK